MTARGQQVVAGAGVALAGALGVTVVAAVALYTPGGQRIDETSLRGARIGRGHLLDGALTVLGLVSVVGLAVAICAVAGIAFSRRRVDLAVAAVVLVVGANITTQVLKLRVLDRPDLGIDTINLNSLPSGHSTVAASVAVALVLVVPPRMRGGLAAFGALTTALTGAATLAAGWHRPSDVLSAFLVVATWMGLVTLGLAVARPRTEPDHGAVARFPPIAALLIALGVIAVVGAAVATWRTLGLTSIARERFDLLLAYGAGASAIAGMAALLLATAHLVAPPDVRTPRDLPDRMIV